MSSITKLNIAKTAKLLQDQGFGLQITDKAVEELGKEGYDPVYGARPLRRLIQTAIENPIALEIISKKFIPGDIIQIDFDDKESKFLFTKAVPPPAQAGQVPGQPTPPPGVPGTPSEPGSVPMPGGQQLPGNSTPNGPQTPASPVPQAPPPAGTITDPTDPVHSAYESMIKSYETQNGPTPADPTGILGQTPPQPQTPPPPPGGNGATMAVGSE